MDYIYLVITIAFSVFAGFTDAFQIAERYGDYEQDEIISKRFGFWWHLTQLFERAFGIILGYFLFIVAGFDLFSIIVCVVTSASIFWTVYDGLINTLRKNPRWWFYQSDQTTSFMESWGGQVIKLVFLFVMLIIYTTKILLHLF